MNSRRPGRPRGTSRTRDAIREAARVRFGRVGYRHATMRAIAADAGVDSALIHYYFGSKRDLLSEVLTLPADPAALLHERLALPLDRLPYAVLSAVVAAWESPEGRPGLFAQVVSIGQDDAVTSLVRDFIQHELAAPLARRLEDDGIPPAEARTRAGAFVSQVLGLVFARYVLAVGPIADAPREDVVETIAPALESLLRGTR